MRKKPLLLLLLLPAVLLAACQTPWGERRGILQRDVWEHKGVAYRSSSEYLEAVRRDQFASTYPLNARLEDFRGYDDARLGLYYFYYVRSAGQESPLSRETRADLLVAMAERGAGADWLPAIDGGHVRKGMPLAALYASWGEPWNGYRNQTRDGETIQHTYLGDNTQQRHVFTVNGVVTGWRE